MEKRQEKIESDHISVETQAERVLKRFGGAIKLHTILKDLGRPRSRTSIYRWLEKKEDGGTGGLIPTSAWDDILFAARYAGILFSAEDMDPRPHVTRQSPTNSYREHKRRLYAHRKAKRKALDKKQRELNELLS